ncbi:hypothetical protein D3C71_1847160 [compost metagenome]
MAVIELDAAAGAVIECRPGHSAEAGDFERWLGQHAPGHGLARIEVLPPGELLPRGLTGKVLKRQVRQRYATA